MQTVSKRITTVVFIFVVVFYFYQIFVGYNILYGLFLFLEIGRAHV